MGSPKAANDDQMFQDRAEISTYILNLMNGVYAIEKQLANVLTYENELRAKKFRLMIVNSSGNDELSQILENYHKFIEDKRSWHCPLAKLRNNLESAKQKCDDFLRRYGVLNHVWLTDIVINRFAVERKIEMILCDSIQRIESLEVEKKEIENRMNKTVTAENDLSK